MAKKDKAAKAGRIPKRIGGVKLSKGLRKSGEALIAQAGSPEGRRVIAAGLAMASAAVARARATAVPPVPPVPPRPAEPPVPPVPPVPPRPPEPPVPPVPPVPPIPPVPPVPPVPPRHPAPDGMGTPVVDPAQIAEAVGQAATAFFDGLFGRKR